MGETNALIIGKDEDGKLHLEAEMTFHHEAVTRVMTSLSTEDKTAPPTYTDDLVTGKFWNKGELASLRAVAYGDPLGNNITVGVAENALIDGWRYVKEIGDIEEVPAAAGIHKDFELCHAQYWLTQQLISERIFGDGLLYTGPKTFRQDIMGPTENTNKLDVFTPEYYTFPTEHFDDMGLPTKVKLTPNPQDQAKSSLEPYSDFIHYFSRPKGRFPGGYSAMYSVWSYITLIRHSAYNLGWAMQKFGTGALIIFLSGRLTKDTEASLKLMLQKASQQRAGVVDANLVDRIEYIGPTGSFANNIPECIDMFASFVAAGSKISKSSLMGQSGMGAGGEVDDKQYYASISKVQQAIAPYIKELARRRGHPTDWLIDFKAVFAKDERQQAEIRVLNADALLKEKQAERGDIMVNFGAPPQGGQEQQQEEFKDPDKIQNRPGVR